MAEDRFSAARLQRLAEIEDGHFWFAGRRNLVSRLLNHYLTDKAKVVLDVGCGTGSLLASLTKLSQRVVGLDLRREGLAAIRQKVPSAILLQADACHLPLASDAFDAAIALDVLEHLDDRALLAEMIRILRPGGFFFLTVPALPSLWSFRDEAAGHLRRYTRRQLLDMLTESGFRVCEIHYYQCLLLPLVVISRWRGRRNAAWRDLEDAPHTFFNQLLTYINRIETNLSRTIKWPCGSSLAVVCQKK